MNAVILHGTSANHRQNWFPWLKAELEKLGYEVWVPDLPGANNPSIARYNKFLLNSGWDFNDNLLIGHSSGAVSIMGLLQSLPGKVQINTAVLAGIYKGDLGRSDLKGTNIDFDFSKIQRNAKKIIVVHSDDDSICPIDDAKWLAKQLDADFIEVHGLDHLSASLNPRMVRFPELLQIIKEDVPEK